MTSLYHIELTRFVKKYVILRISVVGKDILHTRKGEACLAPTQ